MKALKAKGKKRKKRAFEKRTNVLDALSEFWGVSAEPFSSLKLLTPSAELREKKIKTKPNKTKQKKPSCNPHNLLDYQRPRFSFRHIGRSQPC
jgi:hypothetical protein